MIKIKGAIVTINAMGCQRAIARTIRDENADYVLALKGNQGPLHGDVTLFVAEKKTLGFRESKVSRDTAVDGDYGRIETRATTVIHNLDWHRKKHQCTVLRLSPSSAARVRSVTGSSMRPAFESPHCSSQPNSLGRPCEATEPSRTVSTG